ncbi:MAG TPA: Ig-like domain-containing protein [Bacteroidota bacterium]|nr:Ig-like domain-containing protein [Bacteroidota bacterium]
MLFRYRVLFVLLVLVTAVPYQILTARGVNTPPTIIPVSPQIVQENTPLGPIPFTIGDAESAASTLSVTATSGDSTLIRNGNLFLGGTDSNRTLTIVPDSNVYGRTTIVVSVSDGQATTTDTIQVKVNNPPRLDTDLSLNVVQSGSGTITNGDLISVDNDNTAAEIIFTIGPDTSSGVAPAHGVLKLNGLPLSIGGTFTQDDVNNNRVTYKNDGSESATDFFTFTVRDADGGIASDHGFTVFHFNIAVTLVNQPPVALDSVYTLAAGNTLHGRFRATDPDSPVLTYSIVTNGTRGTATIDNDTTGDFTYVPQNGALGADTIVFQVSDGSLSSAAPGHAIINLQTFPPTALNGSWHTIEQTPVTDTLRGQDPNVPALPLSFFISADGANGHAVVLDSVSGLCSYTPNPGFFGADTFRFRVRAGALQSGDGLVSVSIKPKLLPGDILIADNSSQVELFDPSSGKVALMASGDSLGHPSGVVASPAGDLYVIDMQKGLVKISGATGLPSQLVPSSSFSSGPIGPTAIAMEHNGMLLVADGANGIKRIDPKNGNVTVVSSGDSLKLALGLCVGSNGDIFVGDGAAFVGGTSRVMKIDPVSGAQTILSRGNSLLLPIGMTADDSGHLYVADPGTFAGGQSDNLLKIDITTGLQSAVLHTDTINRAIGVGLDTSGRLYVANNGSNNLLAIDPQTGNTSRVLSGPHSFQPFQLSIIKAEPNLVASRSQILFGKVPVGNSRRDSIIVQNTGTAPLIISSVVSDSSQFQPSPTSATIPPGGAATFVITFTPTTSDSISSGITFTDNGLDVPFVLNVIGGTGTLGVKNGKGLPKEYALYNNYPNPFNPSTTIQFDIPHGSLVSIRIYDILGRIVDRLVDQKVYPAGQFTVRLDGSNLASGIYFFEMTAISREKGGNIFHKTGKMTLLK